MPYKKIRWQAGDARMSAFGIKVDGTGIHLLQIKLLQIY